MACAKKTKIDVKIRLFTRHVFIFFAQAKKISFYYETVSDGIKCKIWRYTS
jgi:hypothetical protein